MYTPNGNTLHQVSTSAQRCPTLPNNSTHTASHPQQEEPRGLIFSHASLHRMHPTTVCQPLQRSATTPLMHPLTTTTHQQLVFLQSESRILPATYSRSSSFKAGHLLLRISRKSLLARAGDIESNPGPPGLKCDSCGKAIRSNQMNTKVDCAEQGCSATPHRCPRSGISRYALDPVWICRHHRGDPPLSEEPVELPPSPCDTCGRTIKADQVASMVRCNQPECQAATHRCQRSGISRYSINPSWTCRIHRGEPPIGADEAPAAPADNARVRCLNPTCKTKTISNPPKSAIFDPRLRCILCGRFCHKQTTCSRIPRDLLPVKENNWTCFLCTESREQGWTLTSGHRDPPLPPPAPTIAAAAAGAAGDERSGVNI